MNLPKARIRSRLAVTGLVGVLLLGCATHRQSQPSIESTNIPPEQARMMAIANRPSVADVPMLVDALESSDPEIRLLAVRGLTVLAPPSALEALYRVYLDDPDTRVAQAAYRALQGFPEDVVDAAAATLDPIQQARERERESLHAQRQGAADRRLAHLAAPADEEQMEDWVTDMSGDVGFFVENIELLKDHAPPGHPLGYNGKPNGGELLEYRLTLKNSSLGERRSSSAYCYTFDKYCTVINRELNLPTMAPGEIAVLENTLLVLISGDVPPEHRLNLYLEVGDSYLDAARDGQPVYRAMPPIDITNRGLGPVRFEFTPIDDDQWGESDGNGNGLAEWGECVELRVVVRNDGPDTMRDAMLTLSSLSTLATITTTPATPASPGDIPPGGRTEFADGRPGFARQFSITLATGYAGDFEIPLLLTLTVPIAVDDEEAADAGRLYIQPRGDVQKMPRAVATFTQRVILRVGTPLAKTVGKPATYRPFDANHLIRLFVLGDNRQVQTNFLETNETRWIDFRENALVEELTR